MSHFNYIKSRRIHLAAILAVSSIHILPRTVFLEWIEEALQFYHKGMPIPLPQHIKQVYDEVLDDMHVSDETRKSLKPMFTPGNQLHHVGYVTPNLKCLICIPENFRFTGTYDVPLHSKGWIGNIDLTSADGKDSREAFVLSKNAQKYALAREICEAENPVNYVFPFIPAFVIAQNFVWLHQVHTKLTKLLNHSKWYTRGIFSLLGSFSFLLYFFLKDTFNYVIEDQADKKVSMLNPEYIKGGIEYWEKKLWLNRITRTNLPYCFRWVINKEGDLTQYVRWKHVPILRRKKDLEDILSDYKIGHK